MRAGSIQLYIYYFSQKMKNKLICVYKNVILSHYTQFLKNLKSSIKNEFRFKNKWI